MRTFAPVLLTSWDDGTVTDLSMAELLTHYGFSGTFFATAGYEERDAASPEMLASIAGLGHEIGNHGVSHSLMTELSDAAIVEEAAAGARRAEMFMAKASPIIAPPKGLVDERVLRTLHSEGLLVRSAPIVGRANAGTSMIEPTAQLFGHSAFRAAGQLVKRRTAPEFRLVRPWLTHRELWSRMAAALRACARSAVPFHIWGHTEEVETFLWWERFEALLALARDLGYRGLTLGQFYCGVPPSPRSTEATGVQQAR